MCALIQHLAKKISFRKSQNLNLISSFECYTTFAYCDPRREEMITFFSCLLTQKTIAKFITYLFFPFDTMVTDKCCKIIHLQNDVK